jgi:hypothetical protein
MEIKKYRFSKTGGEWYMDLPEYIKQGGNVGNLQMVEGADKMLDEIAGSADRVVLSLSKENFDGADVLILKEKADPIKGGGYYFLAELEGKVLNQTMWLCDVTEFVLGDIPPEIYLKREKN